MRERAHPSWDGRGGGWVGSQLGGTAWMLLLALMVGTQGSLFTAASVVALFAFANGVGVALWALRHRLRFWTALIWLVVACGATGAASVYVLQTAAAWEAVQVEPWVYPAEAGYVVLAVVCVGTIAMLVSRARREVVHGNGARASSPQ